MRLFKYLSYSILLLAVLFIAAYSGGNGDSETTATEEASTGESEEKVLTIGLANDVQSFDMHQTDDIYSFTIYRNLFSPLFAWDENNELQPLLIEEYEHKNDTTWTFTLKDNITFHNGIP